MAYHFRFQISKNIDGSRVSYSPNWHGTLSKCPKNVTVLLYDDNVGYGIAKTEDTFVPPEVTRIFEIEANKILAEAKDMDGVYFGQKLADRWLPEAETEDIKDTPETLLEESTPSPRKAVDTFHKSCPICHKMMVYVVKYEDKSVKVVQNAKVIIDGLIAKEVILVCPDKHRVKIILEDK